MADLGNSGESHGKHTKQRAKKQSSRVDMTPMVDLAFLLLTFFVLTTTFRMPQVMEVMVPAKGHGTEFLEKSTVTVLIDENNRLFWYTGKAKGTTYPTLNRTTYNNKGLRKILLDKNTRLNGEVAQLQNDVRAGKLSPDSLKSKVNKAKGQSLLQANGQYGLLVIVKPVGKSSYKNLVDVFDELNITNVASYALVQPEKWEVEALKIVNATAMK